MYLIEQLVFVRKGWKKLLEDEKEGRKKKSIFLLLNEFCLFLVKSLSNGINIKDDKKSTKSFQI